jgi:hypothetical protein
MKGIQTDNRLGDSLPDRWLRQKLGGAVAEPMLLSALSTGNHQLASRHWGNINLKEWMMSWKKNIKKHKSSHLAVCGSVRSSVLSSFASRQTLKIFLWLFI